MDSKSICASCTKNCDDLLKAELAMKGCVTNIYLRKGPKITYACKLYSARKNAASIPFKQQSTVKVKNNSTVNTPISVLPDLSFGF